MPGLREVLFRRWQLKVAAVALSVILWVLIQAEETTSQLVSVELELEVPPTLALARPAPPIRALVFGPGRELIKLYAAPVIIHAAIPANATVPRYTLAIAPGDIRLPRNAKVTIQDVEPREVELDIDRFVTRNVRVALRGVVEAESGFALSGPLVLTPNQVRVSGPRMLVAEVDSVVTEPIEVRGVTAAFERTVPLDTLRSLYLRVSPREVVLSGRVRKS